MAQTQPRPAGRRRIGRLIRFVLTIALIGYVLYSAELTTRQGWASLLETVRGSHLGFLVMSFLFTPLLYMWSTFKWCVLARSIGMNVRYRSLFYYFVVGRFYNLVLPSNIGGDLVRVHMLGRASGRYADAAATVVVERLTGLVTLVALAFGAIAIAAADFHAAWLIGGLGVISALLAAMCWAIIDERPFALAVRLLQGRNRLLDKLLVKLAKLHASILLYKGMPGVMAVAFLNSVIFYLFATVNLWLTLRVFSDIGFLETLVANPILMIIMNLPLSIGNIGIMEFAYTFVMPVFGVGAQAALSAALLMRVKMLLAALGGGVAHAFAKEAVPRPEVIEAAAQEKAV